MFCDLTIGFSIELELPDLFNDLDIDFTAIPQAAKSYQNDLRNQRKIKEAVAQLNVNVMNPLRPGKSMLVLDLDYSACLTRQPRVAQFTISHPRHQATDEWCPSAV